jgi:DNA-binding response OmpR family regulator
MNRTVLVVEDDANLAQLVRMHVEDLGCHTISAADGGSAIAAWDAGGIDLVILDLMLPDMDGLSVCRHVRASGPYVPVLMLTARSSEADRVLGLDLGADDYLAKPFSVAELQARIKALFRRVDALSDTKGSERPSALVYEDLLIDPARRKVEIAGHPVELTAREFDLLHHFASHPGLVFTRAQLLDKVWGYTYEGYEHTVNTHINRLRAKIERDPAHPRYVQTVWGVGYRFAE